MYSYFPNQMSALARLRYGAEQSEDYRPIKWRGKISHAIKNSKKFTWQGKQHSGEIIHDRSNDATTTGQHHEFFRIHGCIAGCLCHCLRRMPTPMAHRHESDLPGRLHTIIAHLDRSPGWTVAGRKQRGAGRRHFDLCSAGCQRRHKIQIKSARSFRVGFNTLVLGTTCVSLVGMAIPTFAAKAVDAAGRLLCRADLAARQ